MAVEIYTEEQLIKLREHRAEVEKVIADAEKDIKSADDPINPDPLTKQKVEMNLQNVLLDRKDADGKIIEASALRKKSFLENKKTHFENTEGFDKNYFMGQEWRKAGGTIKGMMATSTTDPAIKNLQRQSDMVLMLSKMIGFFKNENHKTVAKGLKVFEELRQEIDEFGKALGTLTAGEGSDWVPEEMSAEMVDEVKLLLMVAASHRRISMPTDPYTIPIKVGRSTAYLATEATVDAPSELRKSQMETANVTFNAKTLAVATPFSYEFEEDSIVPVLPVVRQDITMALAEAQENGTINGDTSVVHQDTGLDVESDDQLRVYNGYRISALATAKTDFNTGTEDFSTVNFRNVRKTMGKYGVRPQDLMWVVSINCYIRMLGLSEVLTLDKYGSATPILTGELGRFDGIPVVVSEFVRTDLNASGIYDGSVTTKTEAILVHTPSFWYSDRRAIIIETVKLPLSQQNVMISTQRLDFRAVRPVATEALVGIGYDMAA